MSDVRVQGTPVLKVKTLDPGKAGAAKELLAAKKDGYDTVGVKTPEGDLLVLVRSNKPLTAATPVTIGGVAAKPTFVENEINTFTERIKSPFMGLGGKLTLAAGGLAVAGYAASWIPALNITSVSFIVCGLAFWAVVGVAAAAVLMAGTGGLRALVGEFKWPSDRLTDGMTK